MVLRFVLTVAVGVLACAGAVHFLAAPLEASAVARGLVNDGQIVIAYPSLFIGVAGGVLAGQLSMTQWSELPEKVGEWLSENTWNFYGAVLAIGSVVVLLAQ